MGSKLRQILDILLKYGEVSYDIQYEVIYLGPPNCFIVSQEDKNILDSLGCQYDDIQDTFCIFNP
jgi:hypothetical protein